MTIVSLTNSAAKRAAYNDWVDQLLALLADANARSGPRPKAMAGVVAMMCPTKADADPHGWQRAIRAVADPARYRPAAKA